MSSGEARVGARSDWSGPNLTFLSLITTGYVIGEIAHFLITTTSQAPGHQQQLIKQMTIADCCQLRYLCKYLLTAVSR